jgi:hypothetical protein
VAEVFDHDLYQLKNKDGKLLKKRYNHQRLKQYFSSLRDTSGDNTSVSESVEVRQSQFSHIDESTKEMAAYETFGPGYVHATIIDLVVSLLLNQ